MISAFADFVSLLTDFVNTLLPFELGGPIIIMVGVILALAAWRILS